jgi:spore coat polysaccharide biosynthesis protein SpsF
MKTVAIIQARMGSTRLPGKMLKEIRGKPLVFYVLNQVKKSKLIDEIILATTDAEKDKVLLETVEQIGFKTFAGDENDVLDRYYQTAKLFKGDIIVRVTGDCPLIDSRIIDKVIQKYNEMGCDYASNVDPPTFPDGLDVEVFSFKVLKHAWKEARLSSEREHVTSYIHNNKNKFKTINVKNDKDLSKMRWTIDETEDFLFLKKVLDKLGNNGINMKNILDVLEKFPELSKINVKFKRNEGYEKSLREDKIVK